MIATYEYQCEKCQSVFELGRDWNNRELFAACPFCQSLETFRIFSPVMTLSRGADGSVRSIGNSCGGCTATGCGGCPSSK